MQVGKVLGGDFAGIVVKIPSNSRLSVGDKVFGLSDTYYRSDSGTYSEYIAVPERYVALMPEGLSFDEAAALPLVTLTAIQSIDKCNVPDRSRILIQGGSGGVGISAIQIAKSRDMMVSTTTSTRNVDFLEQIGADQVIDYTKSAFEEVCQKPVHIVLDGVGGNIETRSLSILDRNGHFVSLLAKPNPLQILKGKLRSWLRLGPRYHITLVQPSGEQVEMVANLWKSGQLKPNIHKVFSLDDVVQAHQLQEEGHVQGKLVLRIVPDTEI